MSNYSIRLENISKRFRFYREHSKSLKTSLVNLLRGEVGLGKQEYLDVLHDVSFDISPGEFVGIMGRNGAGKSTLLKLICGIYAPTSGRIHLQGNIAPLIELGAGFHPELSGYENIFLNAAILGFGKKATEAALNDILEFSELGEKIEMPVRHYSSGMLVRLGFSIATHLDAPILLIDEVLAVGDAGFQAKCLAKIHELHRAGRTIVLITHEWEAVRKNCTRCIVIEKGRTIFDGDAGRGVDTYLGVVR
jgi:ABC-type polysaccharide/polyol phosphate transport system ATPase subunit